MDCSLESGRELPAPGRFFLGRRGGLESGDAEAEQRAHRRSSARDRSHPSRSRVERRRECGHCSRPHADRTTKRLGVPLEAESTSSGSEVTLLPDTTRRPSISRRKPPHAPGSERPLVGVSAADSSTGGAGGRACAALGSLPSCPPHRGLAARRRRVLRAQPAWGRSDPSHPLTTKARRILPTRSCGLRHIGFFPPIRAGWRCRVSASSLRGWWDPGKLAAWSRSRGRRLPLLAALRESPSPGRGEPALEERRISRATDEA